MSQSGVEAHLAPHFEQVHFISGQRRDGMQWTGAAMSIAVWHMPTITFRQTIAPIWSPFSMQRTQSAACSMHSLTMRTASGPAARRMPIFLRSGNVITRAGSRAAITIPDFAPVIVLSGDSNCHFSCFILSLFGYCGADDGFDVAKRTPLRLSGSVPVNDSIFTGFKDGF